MFKLDLDLLAETVEVYKEKETDLLAVKEQLTKITGSMTNPEVWEGEDADFFRESMTNYLNGEFQDMISMVRYIKEDLIYALEEGRTLKAFCDALPKTLLGLCVFQYSEEGACGILSLNPDAVPVVLENAKAIEGYREEALQDLKQLEEVLGSLENDSVYVGEEITAIRKICDELENISFFRTQFEKYASDMEDFEAELIRRFSKYVDAENDYTGKLRCYVEGQKVNPDRLSYLLGMRKELMSEAEQAELAAMTDALYRNRNMELIESMTEEILRKDAETWSEGEAAFAARTWEYYLETKDCEKIRWFVEQLQCVEYGESYDVWKGPEEKTVMIPVTVTFSTDKSEKLLDVLDPYTQGEAYYTLNRIQMFGAETGTLSYDCPEAELGQDGFQIEAVMGDSYIVITMQVKEWGKSRQSQKITSADMNKEADVANMEAMGFDKEQIVTILSGVYKDEDLMFAKDLSRAKTTEDYYRAFEHDPDSLSPVMHTALYQYSYILMDNGITYDERTGRVTGQDMERFETFLNGLLYAAPMCYDSKKSEDYSTRYLENLIAQSDLAVQATAVKLDEKYNQTEVVLPCVAALNKEAGLTGLYQGLYYKDRERMFNSNGYQVENLTFQKENLYSSLYNTYFCFDLSREGATMPVKIHILEPNAAEQKEELDEFIRAKGQEKYQLPVACLKGIYDGLSVVIPELGMAKDLLCSEGGMDSAVQAGKGMINTYGTNGAVKKGANVITKGLDAYQDYVAAMEEIKRLEGELLDDCFLDAVTARYGTEGEYIISRNAYLPETVLKRSYFYHEGLSFLLPEVPEEVKKEDGSPMTKQEWGKQVITELMSAEEYVVPSMDSPDFSKCTEADIKDMLSIVWCGEPLREESVMTMGDMTPSQIEECKEILSDCDGLKKKIDFNDFDIRYKAYQIPELKIKK